MDANQVALIGSALALLGVLAQTIVSWRRNRAEEIKADADGLRAMSESYGHLIDPLNDRIARLEKRVGQLEIQHENDLATIEKMDRQIGALEVQHDKDTGTIEDMESEVRSLKNLVGRFRTGINKLIDQLKANGLTPVWTPDEIE